jgi:flagellar biogenesis protein FliO
LTRGAATTTDDDESAAASAVLRRAPREAGESAGTWSQLQALWPLAIVLALIGGGVVVLRRWAPGARVQAPSVLRIAARTVVSPKQHLILIELGRRYVLAGVSSDRIEPLCVIADPEEVSDLVGLLRSGSAAEGREFQRLLAEESGAFGDPLEEPGGGATEPADPLGRAGRELSSLLGKLRRMQGTKS